MKNELALESAGIFNLPRLLDLIPVGLRALIKGKLPPLFPHKAEDNKKIKDIARKLRRWNNEVCIYPGCVARGGTPELLSSSMAVLKALDIEVEELTKKAGCTGAGVLQEKNPLLGDTINVRTLAMAEEKKT